MGKKQKKKKARKRAFVKKIKTAKKSPTTKLANKKLLEKLIALGRAKGHLTYEEVNSILPDDMFSSDRINEVMDVLDREKIALVDRKKEEYAYPKEHVPKKVSVDGTELMMIAHAGKVYAVKHACPHYGAPLEEGLVHGTTITCPWHNASFDYTNGALLLPPALDGLPVYPTKTEDGAVLIRNTPVAIPPRKKKGSRKRWSL